MSYRLFKRATAQAARRPPPPSSEFQLCRLAIEAGPHPEPPMATERSMDLDECFVEGVGVVVGEQLGDELSSAADANFVEHRFDVVPHGVRRQEQLGGDLGRGAAAGDGSNDVALSGGDVDESPMAYRRLPEVLAFHKNTIQIEHTLRPFAVAMAGAGEFDPYKD